jgi:hypothetical protein
VKKLSEVHEEDDYSEMLSPSTTNARWICVNSLFPALFENLGDTKKLKLKLKKKRKEKRGKEKKSKGMGLQPLGLSMLVF